MEKSALIIVNPTAGKEKAVSYIEKIEERLKEKYSKIVVKLTKGEGDATTFAKEACDEKFDLVVSLGGDGTVNETVNGLACCDEPPLLGIIPLGTVNGLARALHIPMQTKKAIELLTSDDYKRIDIGLANDTYFSNVLGIGQPAKAVHDVDIQTKTKFGPLAYVMAVGKEILKDNIFPVRLEMDDETWEGEAAVVIIGLIDSLGGLKAILSDVEIGDGTMHILAIKDLSMGKILGMTSSFAFGQIMKSENVKYFQTKNLNIDNLDQEKKESNIDGDQGPELPLKISVLPRHLRVISKHRE